MTETAASVTGLIAFIMARLGAEFSDRTDYLPAWAPPEAA